MEESNEDKRSDVFVVRGVGVPKSYYSKLDESGNKLANLEWLNMEFGENDLDKLDMKYLPVHDSHSKDNLKAFVADTKKTERGIEFVLWMNPNDPRTLSVIDKIKNGYYKDLSLTHNVSMNILDKETLKPKYKNSALEVEMSLGDSITWGNLDEGTIVSTTKFLKEISPCRIGNRNGSNILEYDTIKAAFDWNTLSLKKNVLIPNTQGKLFRVKRITNRNNRYSNSKTGISCPNSDNVSFVGRVKEYSNSFFSVIKYTPKDTIHNSSYINNTNNTNTIYKESSSSNTKRKPLQYISTNTKSHTSSGNNILTKTKKMSETKEETTNKRMKTSEVSKEDVDELSLLRQKIKEYENSNRKMNEEIKSYKNMELERCISDNRKAVSLFKEYQNKYITVSGKKDSDIIKKTEDLIMTEEELRQKDIQTIKNNTYSIKNNSNWINEVIGVIGSSKVYENKKEDVERKRKRGDELERREETYINSINKDVEQTNSYSTDINKLAKYGFLSRCQAIPEEKEYNNSKRMSGMDQMFKRVAKFALNNNTNINMDTKTATEIVKKAFTVDRDCRLEFVKRSKGGLIRMPSSLCSSVDDIRSFNRIFKNNDYTLNSSFMYNKPMIDINND